MGNDDWLEPRPNSRCSIEIAAPPRRPAPWVCIVCGGRHPMPRNKAQATKLLKLHRLCLVLWVPAAGCTIDGCNETAEGPMHHCRQHGGRRLKSPRYAEASNG